jgi:predicted nicotinamide N-methyase
MDMPDATTRSQTDRALAELVGRVPLASIVVPLAGHAWRITGVEDQDRLLEAADGFGQVPYGCLIWDSCIALARHIAQAPDLVRGRRVLELGAGVGFAGLVATRAGASVCQTDHLTEALLLAALNARQNGMPPPPAMLADWRHWQHAGIYDVILGADILYSAELHPALERILDTNLASDGCVVLADPGRPQSLDFVAYLEHRGWRFDITMREVVTRGRQAGPCDVAIMLGRRS